MAGPLPVPSTNPTRVGVLLDEAQLKEYILLYLGAPQLKVELVQEDLDAAVEQAKRWFAAKKGFKKQFRIFVAANTTEYLLPDDVDTVIDVSFSSSPTDFARVIDPLGLLDQSIPYNLFPAPKAAGLFSSYAEALYYIKIAKRVTGGEFEWRQDGRTLLLLPTPRETGTVIVDYKSNLMSINQLSERDHDLVKRWSIAWAMNKLGEVRSKYDGALTAQGTTGLDGMRLKQEALEKFQMLDDEIAQSGFPMGFLVG